MRVGGRRVNVDPEGTGATDALCSVFGFWPQWERTRTVVHLHSEASNLWEEKRGIFIQGPPLLVCAKKRVAVFSLKPHKLVLSSQVPNVKLGESVLCCGLLFFGPCRK